mmetsp:Transcript_15718/g.30920  ORF Transcript_15718/g.30920 Transcript_15718/m.30920 type:complete len:80 (-) Transcript_15718:137-376(-)
MTVSQGDSPDFSLCQFMEQADDRDGSPISEDENGNDEIAKLHAMAYGNNLNSEDTPDTMDSFIQQDPDDTYDNLTYEDK